jgi:methionyl-tRNA synthetase
MTRYLITSAIPYVNGVKHLGNLVGSLLPADVHARFRRQTGADVLFICATDEHGTPTELSAAAAGLDARAFCDAQHANQADIYRRFGLSFDHFGRSSSPQNCELTQHFYRVLDAAGLIEERDVRQVWSPRDGRFLPDRYIVGTCPHCRYQSARGDQCDGCGALLDPPDLLSPCSALSGDSNLEVRSSRHLFLRQSLLVDRLREWVDSRLGWPSWVASLARSWLTEDLRDRCITRDLAWGVPVPRPGFEHKVFYVWFDAPICYLAATKEWSDFLPSERDWKAWWWNPQDVQYVQFLGKDNVPFHTVSFPATLLGSGEPWKTVDIIKGFHWLTYEGGKFSTSQHRGVFTDTALEVLPADLWRWWLIANAPEGADVDFNIRRFSGDVTKDLADVFGNLATRVTSFSNYSFDGRVPSEGTPGDVERALADEVDDQITAIRAAHERLEFRRAAAETRALWVAANKYVQDQAPWAALKTNRARAAVATRTALNLLATCAYITWSIIPELSHRVLAAFGEAADCPRWPQASAATLLNGRRGLSVAKINPLVRKLSEPEISMLEDRFGGGRFPGRPSSGAPSLR